MVQVIGFLVVWFASMWGALQVRNLELGHALCGAWGCGPPSQALLGMHSFWFAAILPPVVVAARRLKGPWNATGKMLIFGSLIGLVGFGIYDFYSFNRGFYEQGYIWQRYLLSLVSQVDIPITQVLVSGFALVFLSRDSGCCGMTANGDGQA